MKTSRLVPELYCSDFERSLRFYTGVVGFKTLYSRLDERFAFLDRDGAQLMIEQTVDPARQWVAGECEYPYGRGLNLQIQVDDVSALYEKVRSARAPVFLALEEKWYQREKNQVGQRQFIVQDPDGYLLRFFESLGEKSL